jgi:hypothetical protein
LGRKQVHTELCAARKDNLMTIASPTARLGTPRIRMFASALLLGAAGAAAIAVAPMAQAATTAPPACSFTGDASVCETDGNAQVSALQPSIDYQAQYPFYGYEGLLFHHRGRHG